MHFSLSSLQAPSLINTNLLRLFTKKILAANIKLICKTLSLMTSKMRDIGIDHATDVEIVKELWSRLLT